MDKLLDALKLDGRLLRSVKSNDTAIYDGKYRKAKLHLEVTNGDLVHAYMCLDNWHFEGLSINNIRVQPPFGGVYVLPGALVESLIWLIAR